MKKTNSDITSPGERVAEIEEFEAGKNTFISFGTVRSSALGTKEFDFRRRIVKILQKNSPELPKIGDVVVGYIEMLFGSMISVKVLYLNSKISSAGFSAISSTRFNKHWSGGDRERRGKNIFRVGDVIRGRVISLLNSGIHITIEEKEYGVLYSTCYNCGGNTVRVSNGIKCTECGIYEDKKLTSDYGQNALLSVFNSGQEFH